MRASTRGSWLAIGTAMLVLALAACGGASPAPQTARASEASTETTVPQAHSPAGSATPTPTASTDANQALLERFVPRATDATATTRAGATATPTPTATATPTAAPPKPTVVTLVATAVTAAPGQELDVWLWVTPGDAGISGGEAIFAFPPSVFEMTAVRAGSLLGDEALVGVEGVDATAGRLTYAAARIGLTSVPSAPGGLAIVTLRVLADAPAGSHDLELTVQLADDWFERIELDGADPATITVTPG